MTVSDLPSHREHLLASIRRLLNRYNSMDPRTKKRADRTMANLHQELNRIDEILCHSV